MRPVSNWARLQGFYSPAFRGFSSGGVLVGKIIGMNYGEGFDIPLGRFPPDRLRLPARNCEAVSYDDENLPQGSRAEILPY